jgi:hypothetical protein
MPNWNDSSDIAKYLKAHPDTVVVERRRPSQEAKEKPKAEPSKRDPHYERPAQKQGQAVLPKPRPESTYKVPEPERSDTYHEAWRKPGEYRKLDSAYSPYTNYQALPEFVTKQRRNPVGGFAGIQEMPEMRLNQVEFGTYTPPLSGQALQDNINFNLSLHGGDENAVADYLNTLAQNGEGAGGMFFGDRPPPVTPMDWGYGPSAALLTPQKPDWRKTDDFWRRLSEADIVPAGQAVPLGQQMHPNYGPRPESYYFKGNADVPMSYFMNEYNTYR